MKKLLYILIAMLIFSVSLSACTNNQQHDTSFINSDISVNTVNFTSETSAAKKVKKDRPWVYDTDVSFSKTEHNKMVIPCINIDSDDAKNVNLELIAYAEKIDESYKSDLSCYDSSEGDYPWYTNASYDSYLNGNILSLKVNITSGGTDIPLDDYKIYNFNLDTSFLMNQNEIIKAAGLTPEYVDSQIKESINKEIQNNKKFYSNEEDIKTDLEKTISDYEKARNENKLQLYLDGSGNLRIYLIIQRSPTWRDCYPVRIKI